MIGNTTSYKGGGDKHAEFVVGRLYTLFVIYHRSPLPAACRAMHGVSPYHLAVSDHPEDDGRDTSILARLGIPTVRQQRSQIY